MPEGIGSGVEPICRVLQFAPATYYAHKSRTPSARAQRDLVLRGEIERVYAENYRVYGADKIWAQGSGYALDPLAASEVTALIATTLADHREIARNPESLADLIQVLNTFVDAGWPDAQMLVWRLDEVFR